MHLMEASASRILFSCHTTSGVQDVGFAAKQLVLAGWTGRDHAAREAHIEELARLGVARPAYTPIFYRVSASLITRADTVQVSGLGSTGEAEFVLFSAENRLWITVGSDHTDREVEKVGLTFSKQLCQKPIGDEAWALDEIEDHWDQLLLCSFALVNGEQVVYQQGAVHSILSPMDLLSRFAARYPNLWSDGWMMFCGTLPVEGDIRWADAFSVVLEDPVLGRSLRCSYRLESLPVEG